MWRLKLLSKWLLYLLNWFLFKEEHESHHGFPYTRLQRHAFTSHTSAHLLSNRRQFSASLPAFAVKLFPCQIWGTSSLPKHVLGINSNHSSFRIELFEFLRVLTLHFWSAPCRSIRTQFQTDFRPLFAFPDELCNICNTIFGANSKSISVLCGGLCISAIKFMMNWSNFFPIQKIAKYISSK